MAWTTEEQLEYLKRLPWSVKAEVTPENDLVLRVVELPAATGSGPTSDHKVAERDLWESLTETLRAYLQFGDPIPLPVDEPLPWTEPEQKAVKTQLRIDDEEIELGDETAAALNQESISRELAAA